MGEGPERRTTTAAAGATATVKPCVGLAAVAIAACTSANANQTTLPVRLEVVLDQSVARLGDIGALSPSFDVSPSRFVLLADDQHLYLLGWGGPVTLATLPGKLGAVAYTTDGLLLAIRERELDYVASTGELTTFFDVPNPNMGLAAGEHESVYLFDRENASGRFGLYRLEPGRRLTKVLEAPQPIDDVTSGGGRVYFASSGAIFEATPGRPMRLVASIPGAPTVRISSLATDERGERIYFSDGVVTYGITGKVPTIVSRTLGGTLRVRDEALIVLDAKRQLLVRFAKLP